MYTLYNVVLFWYSLKSYTAISFWYQLYYTYYIIIFYFKYTIRMEMMQSGVGKWISRIFRNEINI